MLANLAIAFALLALSVAIHAVGLAFVMLRLELSGTMDDSRFGPCTLLLMRLAMWVVGIHCAEVAVWACFYWWQRCLPDFESSLYFAVVTYTTVGYGDVVLPLGWRILSGVEALTGILMCGWTTGFFFIFANRIYTAHSHRGP